MADVWLAFTKYDGSLHWHQMTRRLGEDAHGVWLGGTKGTILRKGHDDVVTEADWPHVILIPRDAWWTAAFNGPGARNEIYCDITTPPVWPQDGEVTMVDLDLDVLRMRDGRVLLDDADEFAEHQVKYAYPPDVIASAEASAAWLMSAVRERRGPFGGAHLPYLDQVR